MGESFLFGHVKKRNGGGNLKKYLVFLLLFLLCGCAGQQTATSLSAVTDSPKERAGQIQKALSEIPGITDSAVVVAGHTAIIGLRTEETGTALGRLIQDAETAARGVDRNLQMVSVTANEAIVERMEETAEGT